MSSARGLFPSPTPQKTEGDTQISDGWIQTYLGHRINPLDYKHGDWYAEDCAHALSNLCRFTGHTNRFYSIAQHCVLVSHVCPREHALAGLLHDASEAYLQDLPTPIKHHPLMASYRDAERRLQSVIYKLHGIDAEPPRVKAADLILLATEARDLMAPLRPDFRVMAEPLAQRIDPWSSALAKQKWLDRYRELWRR